MLLNVQPFPVNQMLLQHIIMTISMYNNGTFNFLLSHFVPYLSHAQMLRHCGAYFLLGLSYKLHKCDKMWEILSDAGNKSRWNIMC
jgi:hypothetical protein